MTRPTPELLFEVLNDTWPPARYVSAGPWTLREGKGGGQRVSAATAIGIVTEPDIAQAEDGMRNLGQRPLFMVRDDEATLDGWLAAHGYDIVDPVTMFLAPTETLVGDLPLTTAIPTWPPLAIQRDLWAEVGIGPARLAVMERATCEKTTVLARLGDTPCGTSYVAAAHGVAMLHALEVMPAQQRNGIGRALLTACANWAQQSGAKWFALAAMTANQAANALYRSAGMAPATNYHYRRSPEVSQ